LELAPNLSQRLHNQLLLKREDMQSVFSFKLRGAYNKMAYLSRDLLQKGVIAASAGNHAQGVALGARQLGTQAIIVMPVTTPQVKIDAVKARGGIVVLHGDTYDDAYTYARQLEAEKGLTFIHPFDDPEVIAGQGRSVWKFYDNISNRSRPFLSPWWRWPYIRYCSLCQAFTPRN